MGIYRSEQGRRQSLALYNKQLLELGVPFSDIFVQTTFGKTHIVETGKKEGKPLLVFHGGNSTTAYNLLMCRFLLKDFHVYAVDTIGHPGKSEEVCLSHRGYAYGRWAGEVIRGLGYNRIACFGGSFGGGILAKLLCVAPEQVEKAVLLVPAGINNAVPVSSVKMLVPLLQYRATKQKKYLLKTVLYMALSEDVLNETTLDTIKDSFDHVKTKIGMPTNASAKKLAEYRSPVLVIAGEKDCLFPAKKVLDKAERVFSDCKTVELKGCGHLHILPQSEMDRIVAFLLEQG